MNWKIFYIFPVAAILVGTKVDPPKLKRPLPADSHCLTLSQAKSAYLKAYALAEESAAESFSWREKALRQLEGCNLTWRDLEQR